MRDLLFVVQTLAEIVRMTCVRFGRNQAVEFMKPKQAIDAL